MYVRPVRIDWRSLVTSLEAAGVDLARELRVDRTVIWRWRVGDRKPNADHAVHLVELQRRRCPGLNPD